MNERIYCGVGGWTYDPWRETFYPKDVPKSRELHYASRQFTAVEVNGTFYSRFTANTFAKWRDETPEGFVFALKAHRFTTHRRDLGTAGEGIANFIATGIDTLGDKLGPLLWQLMPSTRFEPENIEAFLRLLPKEAGGRPLAHVLDVRHASFASEAYLDLLARHGCTTVYTDEPDFPAIPHARHELAYMRLMRSAADCATGYAPEAIAPWVQGARDWVAPGGDRRAFVFFINGAKERAPLAAREFLRQLRGDPAP